MNALGRSSLLLEAAQENLEVNPFDFLSGIDYYVPHNLAQRK
jgi:hypothetical protein